MSTRTVVNITPRTLADRYGGGERWWQRQMPELRRVGALHKRGRRHFGDYSAIEAWLTSGEAAGGGR